MRFQWLKDYQELDEQLLYFRWNLNKSRIELSRWKTGDLSKVKLEKNSRSAKLEKNIETIKSEIERLEQQKKDTELIVQSFKGIDNKIIYYKYIEKNTLEEISEKTGYSPSYIQKKHSELRKSIDFLDEYLINKEKIKYKINKQEKW